MTYVHITWLAEALRDEGCEVVEHGDWQHRGRPTSTGEFNPSGVLWHHTGTHASSSNPDPTLSMCINGRSDLPGPLCHGLIGYDGTIHVIAAGRANHAGKAKASGPMPAGDGNELYVGFEIDYDGSQKISSAQHDAAIRGAAGVLRHLGQPATHARGHKETSTTGKWDPGGVDLNDWRDQVASRLAGSAAGGGSSTSGGDDDMATHFYAKKTTDQKMNGEYKALSWDSSSDDKVMKTGGGMVSALIGGHNYVAGLQAYLTDVAAGTVVYTRLVEQDGDEVVKIWLPTKHLAQSGTMAIQDLRTGYCGKGHKIRWQINAPKGAVVTDGQWQLTYFG